MSVLAALTGSALWFAALAAVAILPAYEGR